MDRSPQLSLFFFAADGGSVGGGKYDLMIQSSQWADKNGFTAVWVPERHFQDFGGLYGSPTVTAAALAVLTKDIQIRAGSVVLPLNNVLRVAEEWSMIDNLSNGRIALSIASGWHVNDFVLAPDNYENRYEDLDHKIDMLLRLWKGETIILPNGKHVPVEVRILPKPIQTDLKLWLTCNKQTSFQKAAERGFNVLTANFVHKNIDALQECIRTYRNIMQDVHGHWGHITFMTHTYVGESESDVREQAIPKLTAYLNSGASLQTANAAGGAPGRDRYKGLTERQLDIMSAAQADKHLRSELTLLGTVQQCSEKVGVLSELGIDEIACLIDYGVPICATMGSLERLVRLETVLVRG